MVDAVRDIALDPGAAKTGDMDNPVSAPACDVVALVMTRLDETLFAVVVGPLSSVDVSNDADPSADVATGVRVLSIIADTSDDALASKAIIIGDVKIDPISPLLTIDADCACVANLIGVSIDVIDVVETATVLDTFPAGAIAGTLLALSHFTN